MTKLIQFMLDKSVSNNSTSTLINGVTIIIDIIRHNNMDLNHESSFAIVLGFQQQQQSMPPTSVSLVPMLTVLTQHIQQLNDLLIKPIYQQTVKPNT